MHVFKYSDKSESKSQNRYISIGLNITHIGAIKKTKS